MMQYNQLNAEEERIILRVGSGFARTTSGVRREPFREGWIAASG